MTDAAYMARALQLAARGLYTTHPNPRVGCLLVKDGVVVGEGWHLKAGGAHAEVAAIEQAGAQAKGATAYVTLEPCCHQGRTPPCSQALIKAGVAEVVIAMADPNPLVSGQGIAELEKAGVRVRQNLMLNEAQSLNRGFVSRMQRQRPWVTAKLAMSLDGKTAAADGSSQWITGPEARADGHRLRAQAGAVLTGIGTVLVDDPQLNVRLDEATNWPVPQRFVLDSQLRMSADAQMLSTAGRTVILTASDDKAKCERLEAVGAELRVLPAEAGRVSLNAALTYLANQEVNEVLTEAGAELTGALLEAGLVDELVVYMAPTLLGSAGRGLLQLPGIKSIDRQQALDITDVRAVGADWRITALPK